VHAQRAYASAWVADDWQSACIAAPLSGRAIIAVPQEYCSSNAWWRRRSGRLRTGLTLLAGSYMAKLQLARGVVTLSHMAADTPSLDVHKLGSTLVLRCRAVVLVWGAAGHCMASNFFSGLELGGTASAGPDVASRGRRVIITGCVHTQHSSKV
jgi:hypothetical protein